MPAGVVRNAVCDVLVVQTSALDEDRLHDDRLFPKEAVAADEPRPVTGPDPEGRSGP